MAHVVSRQFTGTAPVGTGMVVVVLDIDSADDYDETAWIRDPDLGAVDGVPIELWKLIGEAVEPMDAGEAASVQTAALEVRKAERRAEIDARTRELIAQGFAHAGKTFSLSREAQIYFSNMFIARAILTAQGAFPLRINTHDDLDTHDIADEAEVATLYTIAVATVKAHLGSGTEMKRAVRAATTQAELDAMADER